MADDKQEHAALGVLSAEPVQALIEVGVGHRRDRFAGMGERVLKRGDDLSFVGGGLLQPFYIDAGRRGCANELIDVVVGSRYVQKYLGERTYIRRRTPTIFIRGHTLFQAHQLVLLDHYLGEDFRSIPGDPTGTPLLRIDL